MYTYFMIAMIVLAVFLASAWKRDKLREDTPISILVATLWPATATFYFLMLVILFSDPESRDE